MDDTGQGPFRSLFIYVLWKAGWLFGLAGLIPIGMSAFDAATCTPAQAQIEAIGPQSVAIRFSTADGRLVRMRASAGKLGLSLPTDPPPNPLMALGPAQTPATVGMTLPIVYRGAEGGARPYVARPVDPAFAGFGAAVSAFGLLLMALRRRLAASPVETGGTISRDPRALARPSRVS